MPEVLVPEVKAVEAREAPCAVATIEYDLDVHDIVAASRLQIDHDPQFRRRVLWMRWGLPFGLIAIAAVMTLLGTSPIYLAGAAFIGLSLFFSASNATRAGLARVIRKQFEGEKARGVLGAHAMSAQSDGLLTRSEMNESTLGWDGLNRILDTGDCLFIYLSPFSAHIVPREKVTAGDYDAFVSALNEFKEVTPVKNGESFAMARAAGSDLKPVRPQKARALKASLIGVLAVFLWGSTCGHWIATVLLPGNLPEPLWWATYNLLIAVPGALVAALVGTHLANRDRDCLCRRCGYTLRGLSEPRCPECGESI